MARELTMPREYENSTTGVVAKTRVETRDIEFAVDEPIERALESTGKQLRREAHGKKAGAGIDRFVARHGNKDSRVWGHISLARHVPARQTGGMIYLHLRWASLSKGVDA